VESNLPVLILSGAADPITPPRHAQEVAESLTNEIHLIFANMGHGNLFSRCSINIFKDFVESASIDGLDTSCVEEIQPPPFFVDFSGPRP
jgi:pimeloyl-ACP methyl ester carboxylesterase